MKISRRHLFKNAAALGVTFTLGTSFLRPTSTRSEPIRPPGAIPEEEFLARCIQCGRCTDACPNRAIMSFTKKTGKKFSIVPGSGATGTPVIYPRQQACNLCAGIKTDNLLCTDACPTGALGKVHKTPGDIQKHVAMGKAVLDKNLCYSYNGSSCGVCVKACPFERQALKAGYLEQPILNPDYCVGCGLCERSCIRYPQAITVVPVKRNK